MLEFNYFNDDFNNNNEEDRENYPDYFQLWDLAVSTGKSPGYVDADELCDIIDLYLADDELDKARFAIEYLQKLYPDNEDTLCEVFLSLNEYGLWDDLLAICEKYKDLKQVWTEGHKLAALLNLGMEEDAFHFFRNMKIKYTADTENLLTIYQAMTEALYDVDLYDASIEIIEEAFSLFGQNNELLWTQLHCFSSTEDKDNTIRIAQMIQQSNPMDAESWSQLGEVYKKIGALEKAIEAFEFAQSLGINDPNSMVDLIKTYEQNGNYNKALEKASDYLVLDPEDHHVSMIAVNICIAIEDWKNAIKYLDNAIRISPQIDSLYHYKSVFFIELEEISKAKKILEEGIQKTKDPRGILRKKLEELMQKYPENGFFQ